MEKVTAFLSVDLQRYSRRLAMPAAESHLLALSDEQRQVLESWLMAFDHKWDEQRLAVHVQRLPPPGDPLRRPALIEMVKIDLERHWQRGQPVRLESYLK